jgi:hypothetical protein
MLFGMFGIEIDLRLSMGVFEASTQEGLPGLVVPPPGSFGEIPTDPIGELRPLQGYTRWMSATPNQITYSQGTLKEQGVCGWSVKFPT